jgi:hypothetical protein
VTRIVGAFLLGLALGAAVSISKGEEIPSPETVALAEEAGLSAWDLEGAANTTGLSPVEYLAHVDEWIAVGESPSTDGGLAHGWPIGGALGQRIFCIERIESRHGAAMWNPVAWYGQHAQGWLGWLPSTARGVGVVIGNRWSEWRGAAYMLTHGRGREFYGVAAGIC